MNLRNWNRLYRNTLSFFSAITPDSAQSSKLLLQPSSDLFIRILLRLFWKMMKQSLSSKLTPIQKSPTETVGILTYHVTKSRR